MPIHDRPARASGYRMARVYCFDCGISTASVQNGRRPTGYADGSTALFLICRHGTGCNRGRTGLQAYDTAADQSAIDAARERVVNR